MSEEQTIEDSDSIAAEDVGGMPSEVIANQQSDAEAAAAEASGDGYPVPEPEADAIAADMHARDNESVIVPGTSEICPPTAEVLAYAKQIEDAADLIPPQEQPETAAAFEARMEDEEETRLEALAEMGAEAEYAPEAIAVTEGPYEQEDFGDATPIEHKPEFANEMPIPETAESVRQEAYTTPPQPAIAPLKLEDAYTYHIYARVAQPGVMGTIAGLYAFAEPITARTYSDTIATIASQNKLPLDKVLLVNFIPLDNDLDG